MVLGQLPDPTLPSHQYTNLIGCRKAGKVLLIDPGREWKRRAFPTPACTTTDIPSCNSRIRVRTWNLPTPLCHVTRHRLL